MLLGATPRAGETHFALWSTTAEHAEVELHDAADPGGPPRATHPMASHGEGLFDCVLAGVGNGALYKFRLDGVSLPDPFARFLPFGVEGAAMVVAPSYEWQGPPRPTARTGEVVYEIHVGTFTSEGTYAAAFDKLQELAALGVTTILLMPLTAFASGRGWGYESAFHFAPFAPYGTPDELRAFIDRAHTLRLSVVMDLPYARLGRGCCLGAYSPEYLSAEDAHTPAFKSPHLRRYVIESALHWLRDYRLDAVDRLVASGFNPRALVKEVAALEPRRVLIGGGDTANDPSHLDAWGLDAVWVEDFHHQLKVTLTRENKDDFAAYAPGVAGLAQTINRGWLYEGQLHPRSGVARGKSALTLSAQSFVYFLDNHEELARSGRRLSEDCNIEAFCAASMLLFFLPMTTLIFMGQEWAASTPFLPFEDDEEAFVRSKLDWTERGARHHRRVHELYRRMIALRASDPVLEDGARDGTLASAEDGVLSVRRMSGNEQRLLLVNFEETPAPSWPTPYGRPGWTPLLSSYEAKPPGMLPPFGATIFAARRSRP